jgi:hypothetical protein
MMQWHELIGRMTAAGLACPPLELPAIEALPLDVSQPAVELLQAGWPRHACAVGTCTWGGPIGELLHGLPLDWPRHLLPLARRGGEVLGWDARTNQVHLVGRAATPQPMGALSSFLEVVAGWIDVCHGQSMWQAPPHVALPAATWEALRLRVGGVALDGWLLQGVCDLETLRVVLRRQRRQAMGTARWTSIVVGLAPLVGWFGGTLMHPPQPALAGGLALLVVGGAPAILMGVAVRRVAQLTQYIDRLPRSVAT